MYCPTCGIGISNAERQVGKCINCDGTFEAINFEQWKKRAVKYLRTLEKKANVEEGNWNFILGSNEDMMNDGYNDTVYWDSPESYVDYQIECAC